MGGAASASDPTTPTSVAVVAGGDVFDVTGLAALPSFDLVIAADSGAALADKLGLRIDLAVGDFDSVTPDVLARLEREAEVERYPTAKDKTDIELALDAAVRRGATSILVISGGGGRLDHGLANLLVLTAPAYAAIDVRAVVGDARLQVIRGRRRLHGRVGETVSLFAIGEPAEGITTTGLRYPLRGERLQPASTRGVSNVFADAVASVAVTAGVLLAIQPGVDAGLGTPQKGAHP